MCLIENIYNIKKNFDPHFLGFISALLGQEWTSPTITSMNLDSNDVIWVNLREKSYPDTALYRYVEIIQCYQELLHLKKITNEDYFGLIDLTSRIPKRFEVPNTVFTVRPSASPEDSDVPKGNNYPSE